MRQAPARKTVALTVPVIAHLKGLRLATGRSLDDLVESALNLLAGELPDDVRRDADAIRRSVARATERQVA